MIRLDFRVNGQATSLEVAPRDRLLDVLRGPLGLVGCREGCGNGECGACTVLVDGKAVNACLVPALEMDGRSVTTIEGLVGAGGELAPLQRAFVAHGAIQCGFCSPGMILAAQALLDANPAPTEDEIRDALVGNLCRCTGYAQIVRAIQSVARRP
jgi:aerobic-type carbon monoxide dehydrogenase small subunit (CoxS/CutS family)